MKLFSIKLTGIWKLQNSPTKIQQLWNSIFSIWKEIDVEGGVDLEAPKVAGPKHWRRLWHETLDHVLFLFHFILTIFFLLFYFLKKIFFNFQIMKILQDSGILGGFFEILGCKQRQFKIYSDLLVSA